MTCRVAGTTPTPAPQSRPMARADGKAGIGADVALRIYTTRLLGSDPLLVLHGGGNTSVKTQMTDLLGETHDVLCVKGSGWDMSSGRACRLARGETGAAEEAASARQADRRGHGQLPACEPARCGRAQSVGGNAAACVPAAHICRPHARRGRTEPCRSTRQRSARRRGLRRHHGLRAVCDPGIPVGQARGGCLRCEARCRRADPGQARHLHVRHGCAGSLRTHDRLRIACGGAAGQGATPGVPCQGATEEGRDGGRYCADHPWRLRREACGRYRAHALRARIPHRP